MSAVLAQTSDDRRSSLVPDCAHPVGAWLRARLGEGARLVSDSRQVRPGDAFFAFPGQHSDGRRFIAQALERGAAAIVHEDDGQAVPAIPETVAQASVAHLAEMAGPIAVEFHQRAVDRLRIAAITGTNGKTSVSHWVAQGLSNQGAPTAIIGTLGGGVLRDASRPPDYESTGLTTPDALGLQRMLAGFARRGTRCVAMEASSIGLDQGRLNGTPIDVAAFTNLTRDHLDYHETMDVYGAAKARLFGWPGLRTAVVNGDDPASVAMLQATADSALVRIVYGFSPGQHGARGQRMLMADRVFESADGISMSLDGDYGRADLHLNLLGRFNVSNALAAAGCWLALGMPFETVVDQLERLEPVTGRMQRLEVAGGPLVVIDYAHTPYALSNALEALRPVVQARGGALWCVFGAGGDRDPGKRPMMGFIAQRSADRLVITTDNPRSEVPFRILSDIRAGLNREPFATEPDRAQAIALAIANAAAEDVVLIAGKGHEDYQEIRGERIPFSDTQHARHALVARSAIETGPRSRPDRADHHV